MLLRSLLDNDKLMGPNFDSWYRKLRIILEHERILYMINDPAPEEPSLNAHGTARDTYYKWFSDRTMVRCIILAAMNDKFNRIFEETQKQQRKA